MTNKNKRKQKKAQAAQEAAVAADQPKTSSQPTISEPAMSEQQKQRMKQSSPTSSSFPLKAALSSKTNDQIRKALKVQQTLNRNPLRDTLESVQIASEKDKHENYLTALGAFQQFHESSQNHLHQHPMGGNNTSSIQEILEEMVSSGAAGLEQQVGHVLHNYHAHHSASGPSGLNFAASFQQPMSSQSQAKTEQDFQDIEAAIDSVEFHSVEEYNSVEYQEKFQQQVKENNELLKKFFQMTSQQVPPQFKERIAAAAMQKSNQFAAQAASDSRASSKKEKNVNQQQTTSGVAATKQGGKDTKSKAKKKQNKDTSLDNEQEQKGEKQQQSQQQKQSQLIAENISSALDDLQSQKISEQQFLDMAALHQQNGSNSNTTKQQNDVAMSEIRQKVEALMKNRQEQILKTQTLQQKEELQKSQQIKMSDQSSSSKAKEKKKKSPQGSQVPLKQFMGFPLAGGPDEDVSRLLSRDLLQQHLEKGRSPFQHGVAWPPNDASSLEGKESFFHVFEDAILNPFGHNHDGGKFEEDSPVSTPLSMPKVAPSDTPIPLPYFEPKLNRNMNSCNDFELDDDGDGLLLSDNAPLFMKLRESERNRRAKMNEASAQQQQKLHQPAPSSLKAPLNVNNDKDFIYSDGFFGPGPLNPFSSSHDRDINPDFLMKDFENLLKRKPQDVHKRPKFTNDRPIQHLNLSSAKPFTALYDRFDDFDDPTYLINQVYYTDCEADINDYHSEVTRGRQNWLQEAYRDFLLEKRQGRSGNQLRATPLINNLFSETTSGEIELNQDTAKALQNEQKSVKKKELSGPKLYLLKLIEFNKIEVLEKYGFASATLSQGDMFDDEQELIEVQSCMTRLMRQSLIRDELRHVLEDYEFEGSLAEQKAIVFSLVKMSKKLINVIYKKCFNFTLVKQKSPPPPQNLATMMNFSSLPNANSSGTKVTEVLWKDTLSESRAYIHMLQKLAELYEHVLDKAQFFRKFVAQIFVSVPSYRFLSLDALFKGFFFMFIYKDFIVRELVQRVEDQLHKVSQRHILQQIEKDYETFMETDLTCWVQILLQIDVFQSYNSIVAPNESVQTNRVNNASHKQEYQHQTLQSLNLSSPFGTSPHSLYNQGKKNSRSANKCSLKGESANFICLQKRYIKGFLAAYYRFNDQIQLIPGDQALKIDEIGGKDNHIFSGKGSQQPWSIRNTAMYLVDSDFDTEDEAYADEFEEVISNHIVNSIDSDSGAPQLEIEEDIFVEQSDEPILQETPSTSQSAAQALKNKKKKQKKKAKKDRAAKAAADLKNNFQTNAEVDEEDQQLQSKNLSKKLQNINETNTAKEQQALVVDEDDDEDDLEEEADEDELDELQAEGFEGDRQFEFLTTLTKPIDGTSYQRERRILAVGNGSEQMHKEMKKMVSALTANFGGQRPSQEQKQEARNKKRKLHADHIFDSNNPFKNNNSAFNSTANTGIVNNDPLTSLLSSFKIPDQFADNLSHIPSTANMNNKPQWIPKGSKKDMAQSRKDYDITGKFTNVEADDILEVSSDEANEEDLLNPVTGSIQFLSKEKITAKNDDQEDCEDAENLPAGAAAEEKKKKKNRRKKRTRKQKQLLLQLQVLQLNGKCTCECHSDLAVALAKKAVETSQEGGKDDDISKEGQVKSKSDAAAKSGGGGSKVVGWSGCNHSRGCQADGECAQDDGQLLSNEVDVAQEATESDVEFDEQLRNFELRLNQQHLRCWKAPRLMPNSSILSAVTPLKNVTATQSITPLISASKLQPHQAEVQAQEKTMQKQDDHNAKVIQNLRCPKLRPNVSALWLQAVHVSNQKAFTVRSLESDSSKN